MRTNGTAHRVAVIATGAVAALALAACGGGGTDAEHTGRPVVGLITKTDTNPFFVTLKEGAQQAAARSGVALQTFAGRSDGDNESQVQAIENLISAGAAGFMITPNDSRAIVPELDRARQAGLVVVALDTPTEPADVVDTTFATDNVRAGELVGRWARMRLGAGAATARIAMLDLSPNKVSVDVQRDQGFLQGFGIPVGDPGVIGDESDPRIVGHEVTDGAEEGGRTAMENLLQKDPSISVVYAINEPAAAGAYEAIRAADKERSIVIVSVDGSCAGVRAAQEGRLGATAQQYPLRMAQDGISAIAQYAANGIRPTPADGRPFTDTGTTLVTDASVPGVDSEDTGFGAAHCWG